MFIKIAKEFLKPEDDLGAMDQLNTLLDQADEKDSPAEPEQDPQEPEQEAEPEPEPKQKPNQSAKMNYAFGQLRQEAANYKMMLEKLAKANGIEFANEQDLMTKLNDDALDKLSKRQNVPVEMLRRLEQLEQSDQAYKSQQKQSQVLVAFQKLSNDYGLDQDALLGFAKELDEAGKNPFTTDIDVEDAYRLMHYDDILNARVNAAVEAALKKSSVADKHSTTPATKRGRNDAGESDKINTVDQLSDFLSDVKL